MLLNRNLRIKRIMSNIKVELKRFFIVGIGAVTMDLCSYLILSHFFKTNLAKGISFVLGTILAYLLNKYWTFCKKEKSSCQFIKFITLYFCTLQINIWINQLCLQTSKNFLLSFVGATIISTILNFIGQKWWIFKDRME